MDDKDEILEVLDGSVNSPTTSSAVLWEPVKWSNQETSAGESSTEKRASPEESDCPEPPLKISRLNDSSEAETGREIDGANNYVMPGDFSVKKNPAESHLAVAIPTSHEWSSPGESGGNRDSLLETSDILEQESSSISESEVCDVGPRWQTEEYKNYVKVVQALYCLKDGLGPFCFHMMSEFRKDVLIKNNLSEADCQNLQCDVKNIKNGVLVPSCPNGICSVFVRSILQEHKRHKLLKSIHWSNSQMQKWPTETWEVSKVYMGLGQKNNTGPKESDAAAILQLMSTCNVFRKFVPCAVVDQILHIRNSIMHADSLSFNTVETAEAFQLMTDLVSKLEAKLLGEPNCDSILKTLTEARSTLNQLENMTFEVVFAKKEEVEVIRKLLLHHKTELNAANDESEREIQIKTSLPLLRMITENQDLQRDLQEEFYDLTTLVDRIIPATAVVVVQHHLV